MNPSRYLIALGSNQRHVRFGLPVAVISAAISALEGHELDILDRSTTIISRPIGPSQRSYANAVVLLETSLLPEELLERLKEIESDFGRRRGRKWSRRVLDLDIIMWSAGSYFSVLPSLVIPHPHLHHRSFVLGPAAQIAAQWRDPVSGLTIAQLHSRFSRHPNHARMGFENPSKPLDPRPKRH